MGTLGRAAYTVGFWIRETGQAMDRLDSRLQGNNFFKEQRPECKARLLEVAQLVEKSVTSDGESLRIEFGVAEPLRAMVVGAPLEDARHHAQRYDKVRQEAESQVIEVARRQAKVKESNENLSKFEAAYARLQELKSNMSILGKEAVATCGSSTTEINTSMTYNHG